MGSTLDKLTSCDHKDSIRGHDGGQPREESGENDDSAADAEMQSRVPWLKVLVFFISYANFRVFM